MKLIATVTAFALISSGAFAGQWGQKSNETNVKVRNTNVSQSYSQSRSNSRSNATGGNAAANNSGVNNSTTFKDRLQAPGLAVSGSYCSNAFGVSGPGFGIGLSFMERACKTEINARTANTYLGRQSASEFVCRQSEFRMLSVCRGRR